jgi:hypothetical protein
VLVRSPQAVAQATILSRAPIKIPWAISSVG